MKQWILVLSLVASSACAIPASVGGRSTAQLTAPGVQALHIIEITKALDIVRDTAIDADKANIVPNATAKLVVVAHKSIIDVMRAAPSGWKAGVLEILAQLRKDIPAADAAHFTPYIDATVSIIKAVIK